MLHEVIHLKETYPFLGDNGCDPTLSVYIPSIGSELCRSCEALRPALLICPGGGYQFVSEREAEPIALKFLPLGYNVFIITYSIAPHCFPTALREVAAAMEVIHAKEDVWNTDTNRIAIMGFSAGGHLACHYSNCYDCDEVRAVFPESKPVNAAILSYPVITADPAHRHTRSFINLSGHHALTEEDIEKFSLNNLVSEKTPPTFLWHTRTDQAVPVMNTLIYAQALAAQGTPFSVHIYPFGAHGLATVDKLTNKEIQPQTAIAAQWIHDVNQWLKYTL